MTTTILPAWILTRVLSLIKKFFWGHHKQRYISYLRWEFITEPKLQGGLGLRDLSKFNQALLVKGLWKMVSGSTSLWINVTNSKYLQRSSIWFSHITKLCTRFWKGLMAARQALVPNLTWVIGDGQSCMVFAQPWFEGWEQFPPTNRVERQMKIANLFDDQSGLLDPLKLTILPPEQAVSIDRSHSYTCLQQSIPDKLMFTYSQTGEFSTGKAYKLLFKDALSPNESLPVDKAIWRLLWKSKGPNPRAKLLVWKAFHNALPSASNLHRRIQVLAENCALCSLSAETMEHLFLWCPHARALWFASPLGVRSDMLTGVNFGMIMSIIWRALDDKLVAVSIMVLWHVWKSRCARLYGDQHANSFDFVQDMQVELNSISSNEGRTINQVQILGGTAADSQLPPQFQQPVTLCWVDGSYGEDESGYTGGTAYVFKREVLIQSGCQTTKGFSAFHLEALALCHAMELASAMHIEDCVFLTDSQQLVHALSTMQVPISCDWRAYKEVMSSWLLLKNTPGFKCQHISRQFNTEADYLGRCARMWKFSVTTHTYPILPPLV